MPPGAGFDLYLVRATSQRHHRKDQHKSEKLAMFHGINEKQERRLWRIMKLDGRISARIIAGANGTDVEKKLAAAFPRAAKFAARKDTESPAGHAQK